MAENDPDGIDEALEAGLRVGLTVAGRLAEQAAREREQQRREAQVRSEQEARELQARLTSERAAARAAVAPVARADWWAQAQPRDIAQAWQTTVAWRDEDPDIARAGQQMREQLRERYDIDVDDLRATPEGIRTAIERHGPDRDDAAAAQERAQTRGDQHEAQVLMAGADRADRQQAATLEPEFEAAAVAVGYDSPGRREDLAESLADVADEETVQARVVADTHQGRPAQEAVQDGPRRAPRARRAKAGRDRAQERTRGR